MGKLESGSAVVVLVVNVTIAFMRWKDKKVAIVISSKYGFNPNAKTKLCIKEKEGRVIIQQPQGIKKYSEVIGVIYILYQKLVTYLITYRSKMVTANLPFLCRSLCKQSISYLLTSKRETRAKTT